MREYHKQVLLGLKFLLSRGLPLVLVSAAAAGVFLLKTPNSAKQATAPGARDPNSTVGQYEGKSEAEIQAELDKVVQEGMFNISINPDIRMTSGRAEAELRVENIPANHHLMSVTLSRDDTGEVLYASGLIEPGYHTFRRCRWRQSCPAAAIRQQHCLQHTIWKRNSPPDRLRQESGSQ